MDEPKSKADSSLEGVTFASGEAHARAEHYGLNWHDFERRRQGSADGFTLEDVERISTSLGAIEV